MMPKGSVFRHDQLPPRARREYSERGMPRLRPVVLALLLSACAPREEPWDRLVLEDLDGKRVGLAASPTVLVFLESDCPVSNKYAPELARLCKEYGSRLSFFAVYPGGSPAEAESHRR